MPSFGAYATIHMGKEKEKDKDKEKKKEKDKEKEKEEEDLLVTVTKTSNGMGATDLNERNRAAIPGLKNINFYQFWADFSHFLSFKTPI